MEEPLFAGFALRSTVPRMVKYFHSLLEKLRQRKKSSQSYVQNEVKRLADGVYFPFVKPTSYSNGYGAIKRLFPDAANYVKGKHLRGQSKEFAIIGHKNHEDVPDELPPGEEEPKLKNLAPALVTHSKGAASSADLASAKASAALCLGSPSLPVSSKGERKPELVSYLMLQSDKLLKQRGKRYTDAGVFENETGSGSFAMVYGPVELPARGGVGESVVIKTTRVEDRKQIKTSARGPGTEFSHAHEECILLDMFRDHPNIVRVRDVFLVDLFLPQNHIGDGMSFLCLGLVLENYGRNCESIIRAGTRDFPGFQRHEVRGVVSDIASALSYVHSFRIIHADVKPNNILAVADELYEVGKQAFHAKLCDFNSSLKAIFDLRFLF